MRRVRPAGDRARVRRHALRGGRPEPQPRVQPLDAVRRAVRFVVRLRRPLSSLRQRAGLARCSRCVPHVYRCPHDASAVLVAVDAAALSNAPASVRAMFNFWVAIGKAWRFQSCDRHSARRKEISSVLRSSGEALSKMCTGTAACATGAAGNGTSTWVLGSSSTCSERCGGGFVNRTIRCATGMCAYHHAVMPAPDA